MRITRMIQTVPVAWMLAALLLSGLTGPAFAAEDANHMPVSVRIPIEYRVDGDAAATGTDTYVLTAEEDRCPMPEGSRGGVKKIEISKPGKTDFGEIIITMPGAYDYTVHRIATGQKNVTKETAVYHVRIAALNTGQVNLIVKKEGKGEKTELIYKDTVKKPGLFHTPKTGDTINPVILIMICAAAAAIIIFLLVRMRSRKFR